MKLLSVIIPVYNVENFIEFCLESLEKQDIPEKEYEIICVNDGSTDRSREIILEKQKKHLNIILLDQKNEGVSAARNKGIEIATGKYLVFVDADDFIEKDSLGEILQRIRKFNVQVSYTGFAIVDTKGKITLIREYEAEEEKIYNGLNIYPLARSGQVDPDSTVSLIIEKKFLNDNNLRYIPDIPYLEDGEFLSRILCLAERCIIINQPFYYRTLRPGSATQSDLFKSDEATNGFLKAAYNLKRFRKRENLSKVQKDFLNQPITKFVTLSLDSSFSLRSGKKLNKTVKHLKKLGLNKVNVYKCKTKYLVCGKAYNASPHLGAMATILYPYFEKYFREIFHSRKKQDKNVLSGTGMFKGQIDPEIGLK